MASLRLYKDFYCINSNPLLTGDTYTLIDPESISAVVKTEGGGSTVESTSVINESIGKYYVDLNPSLYTIDNNYEVNWSVVYVSGAPEKTLITRFRLHPIVVGHEVEIRLETDEIRLEVQ